LLFLAFSRNKFPFELVNHLIKTIGEVPSSSSFCQFPAMVVMSLFARVNPRGMREYLRDFQKCLRSSHVLVACEALRAISYLIPLDENTVDNEDEAYLYHLRAIDSLFPDIEDFLFRGNCPFQIFFFFGIILIT
uniref:Non-specific serine/threonine protein kinase n=1 Tax=Angiostrongylus cantonensis TaxID=6313 RepID=A0A0K0D8I5_ANGCA